MTKLLFRPEAAQAADAGAFLDAEPVAWRSIGAFFAVLLLFLTAGGALADYARKESAPGYLMPTAGVARISAPRAGMVSRVYVRRGDLVAAAAPLFAVDLGQDVQRGVSLGAESLRSITQEGDLLRSRLAAEAARAGSEGHRLKAEAAGLRNQTQSLGEQRRLQEQRVTSAGRRLEALGKLRAGGFVSEPQYRAQEESVLALRQGLASIDERRASVAQQAAETAAELTRLDSETLERRAQLQSDLARLARQRLEVEAGAGQLVRAPVGGRIAALEAYPGQGVAPGRQLLTIVPERPRLQAVLYVSPRAIGFVRPGQSVRLMYDAFPFQRFGPQPGRVVSVSQTTVGPDEADGPIKPREASYRVDVALERQTIRTYGAQSPLQPDMTLRAEIMLERRSLLARLLDPILGAARSKWST